MTWTRRPRARSQAASRCAWVVVPAPSSPSSTRKSPRRPPRAPRRGRPSSRRVTSGIVAPPVRARRSRVEPQVAAQELQPRELGVLAPHQPPAAPAPPAPPPPPGPGATARAAAVQQRRALAGRLQRGVVVPQQLGGEARGQGGRPAQVGGPAQVVDGQAGREPVGQGVVLAAERGLLGRGPRSGSPPASEAAGDGGLTASRVACDLHRWIPERGVTPGSVPPW